MNVHAFWCYEEPGHSRQLSPRMCFAASALLSDGVDPKLHCEGDWAFNPPAVQQSWDSCKPRKAPRSDTLVSGALPDGIVPAQWVWSGLHRAKEWAEGQSPEDRIRN